MNTECRPDPDQIVDELLEAVWTCSEEGDASVEACIRAAHAEASREDLEAMVTDGLLTIGDGTVALTAKGKSEAASIIRRHRLAERLLVDVLGMTAEESERFACSFEHSVVPEVANGICTLLGHPSQCPHGKAIPPGPDCAAGQTEARSALVAMSEAPIGQPIRVAYLRVGDHDRLHQLLSLGFSPGTELRIHQRTPVMVVQLGHTEFAMDHQVAGDVYVWTES